MTTHENLDADAMRLKNQITDTSDKNVVHPPTALLTHMAFPSTDIDKSIAL